MSGYRPSTTARTGVSRTPSVAAVAPPPSSLPSQSSLVSPTRYAATTLPSATSERVDASAARRKLQLDMNEIERQVAAEIRAVSPPPGGAHGQAFLASPSPALVSSQPTTAAAGVAPWWVSAAPTPQAGILEGLQRELELALRRSEAAEAKALVAQAAAKHQRAASQAAIEDLTAESVRIRADLELVVQDKIAIEQQLAKEREVRRTMEADLQAKIRSLSEELDAVTQMRHQIEAELQSSMTVSATAKQQHQQELRSVMHRLSQRPTSQMGRGLVTLSFMLERAQSRRIFGAFSRWRNAVVQQASQEQVSSSSKAHALQIKSIEQMCAEQHEELVVQLAAQQAAHDLARTAWSRQQEQLENELRGRQATILELRNVVNVLEQRNVAAGKQIEEMKQSMASIESSAATLKSDTAESIASVRAREKAASDQVAGIRRQYAEAQEVLEAQLDSLRQNNTQLDAMLRAQCEHMQELQAELDRTVQRCAELTANAEADLAEKHQQIGVIGQLRGELLQATNQYSTDAKTLQAVQRDAEVLRKQLAQLREQLADTEQQLDKETQAALTLEGKLSQVTGELEAAMSQISSLGELQNNSSRQVEVLSAKLASTTEQLAAATADLQDLQAVKADLTTKWEAVQALLTAKQVELERVQNSPCAMCATTAAQIQELQERTVALEQVRNGLDVQVDDMAQRIQQLEAELQQSQQAHAASQETVHALEGDNHVQAQELQRLQAELSDTRTRLEASLADTRAQLATVQQAQEEQNQMLRNQVHELSASLSQAAVVAQQLVAVGQAVATASSPEPESPMSRSFDDSDSMAMLSRAVTGARKLATKLSAQQSVHMEVQQQLHSHAAAAQFRLRSVEAEADATDLALSTALSDVAAATQKVQELTTELQDTKAELTRVKDALTTETAAHQKLVEQTTKSDAQLQSHVRDLTRQLDLMSAQRTELAKQLVEAEDAKEDTDRQLGLLRKQAGELKVEVDQLRSNLGSALACIADLTKSKETAEAAVASAKADLDAVTRELAASRAACAELALSVDAAKSTMAAVADKNAELTAIQSQHDEKGAAQQRLIDSLQQRLSTAMDAQSVAEKSLLDERTRLSSACATAEERAGQLDNHNKELQARVEQLNVRVADLESARAGAAALAQQLSSQIDTLKASNGELERRVAELTTEQEQSKQSFGKAGQALQQQITSVAQELVGISRERDTALERVKALEAELQSTQAAAADLASQLAAASDSIRELQTQLDAATEHGRSLEQQLQSATQDCATLRAQLHTAEQAHADTVLQGKQLQSQLGLCQADLEQERQKSADVGDECTTLRRELSDRNAALQAAQESCDSVRRDLTAERASNTTMTKQLAATAQELEETRSRASSLHNDLNGSREALALLQKSSSQTQTELEARVASLLAAHAKLEAESSQSISEQHSQIQQLEAELQQQVQATRLAEEAVLAKRKTLETAQTKLADTKALVQEMRRKLITAQTALQLSKSTTQQLSQQLEETKQQRTALQTAAAATAPKLEEQWSDTIKEADLVVSRLATRFRQRAAFHHWANARPVVAKAANTTA